MAHKFILSQTFDIKPLKADGVLDWEKIKRVTYQLDLRRPALVPTIIFANIPTREDVLAELAAIETVDQRLKKVYASVSRKIPVRQEGEIINDIVLVNKYSVRQPAFFGEAATLSPAQSSSPVITNEPPIILASDNSQFQASDFVLSVIPPTAKKDYSTPFLILLLVGLLSLNFFLGRGVINKIAENKKISFYSGIIKGTTDLLFAGDLSFASLFNDFIKDYDVFLKFLGASKSQKYLLIFQNNSEMRATGGFIGSYGVFDMDRGKIRNLFFDDVYNIDGQLQEKVVPPAPILKVADFWSMHDANWYADWPTSASKIAWFYEKTGGPTVDGVISLTPTVVEEILKIIGPISLPDYNLTIDSSNFVEIMQYKVERDFNKDENQPKKILVAFSNKFFERLQNSSRGEWPKLLGVLEQMLKEKHVLLFFKNENLERYVLNRQWGGQLIKAEQDFLSVVNSNLGGAKSDRFIEERIEHLAEINEDGSVVDMVRVYRYHRGGNTQYDWWNKPNVDYLRVYVPRDAKLITSASDDQTEIFEENNKTVFARWVTTDPGKTTITEFRYILPFNLRQKYTLYVQKQSGSIGSQFIGVIKNKLKEVKNEGVLREDKAYSFSL